MWRAAPRWRVGEAVIARVDEVLLDGQGGWLLPDVTAEMLCEVPWLDSSATDALGRLRLSVHSFVVDIGGTRTVVDTGVGNGKVRDNPVWNDLETDYPLRLDQAGVDPASVNRVVNTHLHRDHVGWNTTRRHGRWEPTFPNASYLVSQDEWDFWSAAALSEDQERMFADSITPIRRSGQLDVIRVSDVVEIADGIELVSTPGHTPGHMSIRISSAGQSALILGDVLHHPVQVAHPCLSCAADVDPVLSDRTRHEILEGLADTETLFLGTHFTHPTAGFVQRTKTGYQFVGRPPEGM